MATRTATRVAAAKVAETKKRSGANGSRRRRGPAVEVRHVAPQRPSRDQFPSGVEGTKQYRAAEAAYESALLAYAAIATTDTGGNVAPAEEKPRRRTRSAANAKTVKDAEKKQPAKRGAPKASAPKSTAKKAAGRPRATIEPPSGYKSWDDPKLAAFVLREKAKGQTIKAIAATLDLPAEERFWHRVSLVFRAAADAKGIERPRLSAEALASRQAKASA
jgi:hypothetical protein